MRCKFIAPAAKDVIIADKDKNIDCILRGWVKIPTGGNKALCALQPVTRMHLYTVDSVKS